MSDHVPPQPVSVTLSADEGVAVGTAAILQMMRATQKNWIGSDHGGRSGRTVRDRWAQAIHGMMAEYAVCKLLRRCWTAGANGIHGSDAFGVEVRATPWEDGNLIINESDVSKHPDSPFVLVTGHWPTFVVRGWMKASDAALPEWFKKDEKPASYWVPQSHLSPISDLLPPKTYL